MSTQIKDGRRIADERAQDSMARLLRQGQDTSLRSLQVWADLARKLGPAAPSLPAGAAIAALAYDPFEKLLEAQRQVVDELVATQRQLVKQLFDSTATVGGNPVSR